MNFYCKKSPYPQVTELFIHSIFFHLKQCCLSEGRERKALEFFFFKFFETGFLFVPLAVLEFTL